MKQHRGIIAMWKTKITIFVLAMAFAVGVYAVNEDSQRYWQNVGPSWDKLLNPDKYTKQ